MKLTPVELYKAALSKMPETDIDHHCSDLYLRVTRISQELVNNYEYKNQVTRFRDNIGNAWWYDIPFCYKGNDWRTK